MSPWGFSPFSVRLKAGQVSDSGFFGLRFGIDGSFGEERETVERECSDGSVHQ